MRPLDILSVTLVLCATALLLALSTNGAGSAAERAGNALRYPGALSNDFASDAQPHALFELPALPGVRLPTHLPFHEQADSRDDAARSAETPASRPSAGERRTMQLDYRLSQQTFRL